ncbi:hypothetical protein IQ07DRAFT_595071 [Pyrenochaeta sp. DS3sAY3a]|nr:hypothetical protein IQ07DRAFT_595071 [Pyrenochaeta sp. DS3sAY3a]
MFAKSWRVVGLLRQWWSVVCEARTGAAALQAQVNPRLKLDDGDQRSAKCKAADALWMRPARARRDIISTLARRQGRRCGRGECLGPHLTCSEREAPTHPTRSRPAAAHATAMASVPFASGLLFLVEHVSTTLAVRLQPVAVGSSFLRLLARNHRVVSQDEGW